MATHLEIIERDLQTFGLTPKAFDARPLTPTDYELWHGGVPISGYKVPYFDIEGSPVDHMRIRHIVKGLEDDSTTGYIRTDNKIRQLYYPPNFMESYKSFSRIKIEDNITTTNSSGQFSKRTFKTIFLVDDERRAASLSMNHGVPAVSIQGPEGWKYVSRGNKTVLQIMAVGFQDLVELLRDDEATIVIWIGDGTLRNVQREVASLAMEFKFQGLPFMNIRQYIANEYSEMELRKVLTPMAMFPKHPNIRSFIHEMMGDKNRFSRKDCIDIGLAMLSDMESKGIRIRSETDGSYYFFEYDKAQMVQASIAMSAREIVDGTDFMVHINQQYGLYSGDGPILRTFATQFYSEEPIYKSNSYKVLGASQRHTNDFYYQLSPTKFALIDSDAGIDECKIVTNGTRGVMFEGQATTPVNLEKLKGYLEQERKKEKLEFWWNDVISEVRCNDEKVSQNFKTILALLYYISPWIQGWKEIQLPVELVIGEAGSGKSSLFSLRQKIITGFAELENIQSSKKEWEVAAVNSFGLMVMDNVEKSSKSLISSVSAEMCRLVTDPARSIKLKQLYKTATSVSLPVNCTFGATSIEPVFTASDLLDRAVVLELAKPTGEVANFPWVESKLMERGDKHGRYGREAWLAHHIVVLERFFKLVKESWVDNYQSKSRLLHLEQSLLLIGKVFDDKEDWSWIPASLSNAKTQVQTSMDWTLEGLLAFAKERLERGRTKFKSTEVATWATGHEEFQDSHTLTNARRIGRYISNHKSTVQMTTGIIRHKSGNTIYYVIDRNFIK